MLYFWPSAPHHLDDTTDSDSVLTIRGTTVVSLSTLTSDQYGRIEMVRILQSAFGGLRSHSAFMRQRDNIVAVS